MTTPSESHVVGASIHVHRHYSGQASLLAAKIRARNTTIVIGADQDNGVLVVDIDVQADVCRDAAELREQLLLIAEALEGYSPLATNEEPPC